MNKKPKWEGVVTKLSLPVYIGLSTDTKPTQISDAAGMPNGSQFKEMDTGKNYYWNSEASEWGEFPVEPSSDDSSDEGAAGGLVVTETVEDGTHTLNKTWKQIRDAIADGFSVVILMADISEQSEYAPTQTYVEDNRYENVGRIMHSASYDDGVAFQEDYVVTTSGSGSEYGTNTENGYPSFDEIDGGDTNN